MSRLSQYTIVYTWDQCYQWPHKTRVEFEAMNPKSPRTKVEPIESKQMSSCKCTALSLCLDSTDIAVLPTCKARIDDFAINEFLLTICTRQDDNNHSRLGEVPIVQLVSSFTSLDSTASLHTTNDIFFFLVKSNLVQLETSCTVGTSSYGKCSPRQSNW